MLAIPKEYAAFRSAYLAGGYHADAASLDDVQIARNSVRGRFRITNRFAEPDGEPALAAHNVVLWALQLCVIYGCAQQGSAAAKELSLREISLKCLRPIADPTQTSVSLRLRFRRPVPGGIYYVGDIDVDQGAYAGRIGFTFPTG
jgi:hypothetical protein